jgi:RimJ/RimL family protein N-acetyltransferase
LSRPHGSSLPNVTLRRLIYNDVDKTFLWRNHPEIRKWCRQNDVLHMDSHCDWHEKQAEDKSVSMYGVENEVGTLVGVCGLTSFDNVNRRAEFSLYVGFEHHGSGYGEASLRALIRKGFMDYGLNSIWGESFDGNPAVRMFERVGFKHEGVRRDFYYRDGKFIDAHLYSILRSEYVA